MMPIHRNLSRPLLTCIPIIMGMLLSANAQAAVVSAYNIDFGTSKGTVLSSDGAAAGQTGTWNGLSTATGSLLDTTGSNIGATYSIATGTLTGGSGGGEPVTNDNFFSSDGGSWSVTISGISGLYDAYVYAPDHPSVSTGTYTINGTAAASLPGIATLGYTPALSR